MVNLPTIYEKLARDPLLAENHKITPQQYDQFFKDWKKSEEWLCLVANCRRSRDISADQPSLLLAYDAIDPKYKQSDAHTRHEERCCAIAEGIGELVWMFISNFSVLPVLEVATPPGAIESAKLDQLVQPWISIYLPTCCVYFVNVKQECMAVAAEGLWEKVGWIDELHIAAYGDSLGQLDLDRFQSWLAYNEPHARLKLPAYLAHREYFTTHRGEIVAGYAAQTNGSWKFVTLNGLLCGDDTDPIERLFTDDAFKKAVRANVQDFRPWFIQKEAVAQDIDWEDGNDLHHAARLNHLTAIGDFKPKFGVTLTHNLMNQPLGDSDVTRKTASTFTNLLITVPSNSEDKLQRRLIEKYGPQDSKLVHSNLSDATELDQTRMQSELVRVVRNLWDNVDILKIPTSRQMMLEAEQELAAELEKTKRYEAMYRSIQNPLDKLLDLSRNLTTTAGQLSMVRGDHLQSLLANRHRLSMMFEEGYTDPKYGSFNSVKHDATEYGSYDAMAANLLVAIAVLENDEGFHPASGQSDVAGRLKDKLERLVYGLKEPENDPPKFDAHMRTVARLSILAPRYMWESVGEQASYHAACAIVRALQSEWKSITSIDYPNKPRGVRHSEGALASLKRRVHSNFKPSSIALNVKSNDLPTKTATLDDLACFMDPFFAVASEPKLNDEHSFAEMALFHQDSYPFRSVGDVFTAIQAFFKGKQVKTGTLTYFFSGKSRTLKISVPGLVNISNRAPAKILSGSSAQLANLLRQFKDSDDQSASLILGDFLAPVVALIQSRLQREEPDGGKSDSLFSIKENDENTELVLTFKRRPGTEFIWTIGENSLTFCSKQS